MVDPLFETFNKNKMEADIISVAAAEERKRGEGETNEKPQGIHDEDDSCNSLLAWSPSLWLLRKWIGQNVNGTEQPYLSGMGDLASLPPALARFAIRPSLSLDASGLAPLLLPMGRLPTPSTLALPVRKDPGVDLPRLLSRYCRALRLSGNAGNPGGTSAPFCKSISAMGNGTVFASADGGG